MTNKKAKSTTEDHQKVADAIQDKLSGLHHKPMLHEDVEDPQERIKLLEKEVEAWHEKFVAMEKTWRNLAKETIGKEEADKLAKGL